MTQADFEIGDLWKCKTKEGNKIVGRVVEIGHNTIELFDTNTSHTIRMCDCIGWLGC